MHDIDRTNLELGEFGEYTGSAELSEYGEAGPLGEALEVELASELLEVASEGELNHFIGNLISRAANAAGQFVRSDTGRALGGILKNAARQALPVVGHAVGQWVSPQAGGQIGADLAQRSGQIFGLELEGLSLEDREWEVARRFVRFAGAAVQQAGAAPPTAPGPAVAASAVDTAARTYAPGFTRLRGRSTHMWPRSGRWIRRGKSIVLLGG